MPKEKKRPSKNAKAALKILNDSKLLATARALNEPKTNQEFEPENPSARTSTANKSRPEKKRG